MSRLTVRRKAYHRKAYTRKGGVHVKATRVPATTFSIKDVGSKGRGKKLIKVRKGLLTSLGYHIHESTSQRRTALRKADKKYGSVRLWKMLNAQAVFRKRTDGIGSTFKQDRDWVMRNLISKSEAQSMTRPAVKKWKKMTHTQRARAMPPWSASRRQKARLSRMI